MNDSDLHLVRLLKVNCIWNEKILCRNYSPKKSPVEYRSIEKFLNENSPITRLGKVHINLFYSVSFWLLNSDMTGLFQVCFLKKNPKNSRTCEI